MNYRSLLLCLVLFISFLLPVFAQEESDSDKKVSAPRVLKISDADDWQRVRQLVLSPNGGWVAHIVMPNEGDGAVIISRTDDKADSDDEEGSDVEGAGTETGNKGSDGGDAEEADDDGEDVEEKDGKRKATHRYKFEVGPDSGEIAFSHDSKFVAYMESPKDKAAKAAKESEEPLKNKAVLLNLESGEKTVFESAQQFSFSGENPKVLAIRKAKPKGRAEGDEGWEGTDLLIHDLDAGTAINLGNVKSFSFNKSGKFLAMTIDAESKFGNGLQLFHVDEGRIESLDNDNATYGSLSWTREGDAIALLKATKDDEFENERHSLLAFSNIVGTDQKKILLDPADDPAVPDDMTISPKRKPEWNDARTAIFFGIHELEEKEDKDEDKEKGKGKSDKKESDSEETDEGEKSDSDADEDETAGLVIWHWNDPRLQSMQQKQESRDKDRFDLCIYLVDTTTTIRLGDEDIRNVSVARPFKFAVGKNDQAYELAGNLTGLEYSDVYTINLETGKRKLVLEKEEHVFDVSPNGVDLLYYRDEGHFYIYNMVEGTHTNITENVEVSFVDMEDDHNVINPPRRTIGWATEGDHVFLSDGWDIWKVSVDGIGAENLTLNGKAEQIRYSKPHQFDPDVEGIDFSQPVYISAYGEWTKKAGFARIDPGTVGVKMLIWEDARFGSLEKLKDQDVYSYSRSTWKDSMNYFVAGPDLKEARQATDSNRQQRDFRWSDGVLLVDYTNAQGVKLQGALRLPADYIEGKKYPTIVQMYEKLSQNANRYDAPRTGGFSGSIYTSNGYAVFHPDIVFQVNDPGMSSKDCILAGLDAAIATGVVDPDRVGLHGHSWGGYQTAFMITQTDIFKAAVAGAPLTNMISMYSSIYWNSGGANQPIFQSSQGRFKGGYWDNLESYARNSPVYHANQVTTPLILLHNDQDGAVDWNQGIEYFNTLRRLGKPVVLLQYTGENHGVRKPENRKDYSYRMLDFFNHYLKEEEAPKWWRDGIKHLDMEEHIEDYKKEKSGSSIE